MFQFCIVWDTITIKHSSRRFRLNAVPYLFNVESKLECKNFSDDEKNQMNVYWKLSPFNIYLWFEGILTLFVNSFEVVRIDDKVIMNWNIFFLTMTDIKSKQMNQKFIIECLWGRKKYEIMNFMTWIWNLIFPTCSDVAFFTNLMNA